MMRMWKGPIFILQILIVVCIIGVVSVREYVYLPAAARVYERPVIIIDAGHGGFDGGAVAKDGTVEKDINLNIALILGRLLTQSGFDVILTRNDDVATDELSSGSISLRKKSDLKNRLMLMEDNPQAVFVSIHLNKFTTSAATGAQVFYSPKTEGSSLLGESIQKSVVERLQPENSRVIKQSNSSNYLLYNAKIPAVIVECGFLSNQNELALLKNKEYQKKMAFSVYCGIMNYYLE